MPRVQAPIEPPVRIILIVIIHFADQTGQPGVLCQRRIDMLHLLMESMKYSSNPLLGLGDTNHRARQDGRYDPEEQRREGNAMHFDTDENREVEARSSDCEHRSRHCNGDIKKEEDEGNKHRKIFGRLVGGKGISCLKYRVQKLALLFLTDLL